MKSVLLTSNLFLPNVGGIENSLMNLAHEYARQGYRVDIVCSDMNNASQVKLSPTEMLGDNIYVYRYPCQHGIIPKSIFMYFSAYRLMKALKAQREYSIVLARYHFNTIISKWAGFERVQYLLPGIVKNQRENERVDATGSKVRSVLRGLNNRYHHWLQKKAVKNADEIAVFSQNMVEQLTDVFSAIDQPVRVYKPGVNLKRFNVPSSEYKKEQKQNIGLPANKNILLAIGRFVGSKGFDKAIEAMQFLDESFVLCLVGEGAELVEYNQLITELGLEDRVIIHPFTKTPENYYQAADLFLMTSVYETLGQTVIEAQASGLPIVAFKPSSTIMTATMEITNSSTVFFSEKHSSKELAEAIKKAYGQIESGVVSADDISHFACEHFSWETISKDIIDS